MKTVVCTGMAALLASSISTAALAQLQATSPPGTTPTTQTTPPSYKSLLMQGFEIKSTMMINSDVASRLATNAQPDTIMVVLQKGAVSANCWMTLAGWNAHNIGDLPCNVLQ